LEVEEVSDCKTASRRRDTWMEKLIMAKEDLRLRCEGTLSLHNFGRSATNCFKFCELIIQERGS
jgi:hypothetical protein